uniref:AKTx n=1 Tax=Centruroides hentzi TaxID=88313 RepID=A0A2I9LNN8_9SCOR
MAGMAKITLILLIVLVTMHTFANWNAEARRPMRCVHRTCDSGCKRDGYKSGKFINRKCNCYPHGK